MGISGLLKGLDSYKRKASVKEFSGQTLTVDASSWLHKSVYSISEHYVESYERGRIDERCIEVSANYVFKRCQELLDWAEIKKIYLVMDGKRCPLKAGENHERDQRRQANLAEARMHKKHRRAKESEMKYNACIKVGAELTRKVMARVDCLQSRQRRLKSRIEFIWAPYEADAQMAKLCMDGVADAIVTEDSDVLVYLAACNLSTPILYKLERQTGACDILSMEWLLKKPNNSIAPDVQHRTGKAKNAPGIEAVLKSMIFRQTTNPGRGVRLFVQACVLSGCDYAPNLLSGVGLVTAFKHVRDNAHLPPEDLYMSVLNGLRKKLPLGTNCRKYRETLSKSEAVFYYHPVRDHRNAIVTLLSPTTAGKSESSNQISSYAPALHLFDGDLSFLGDDACLRGGADDRNNATTERNSAKFPLETSDDDIEEESQPDHKPPVAEINVPAPMNRDQQQVKQHSIWGKPQDAGKHKHVVNFGNKDCLDFVDTYDKRKPQQFLSQKQDSAPLAVRKTSKNPPRTKPPSSQFAQFALGDKENRQDCRPVKRDFGKEEALRKSQPPQKPVSVVARLLNSFTSVAQQSSTHSNIAKATRRNPPNLNSPDSSEGLSIPSPPDRRTEGDFGHRLAQNDRKGLSQGSALEEFEDESDGDLEEPPPKRPVRNPYSCNRAHSSRPGGAKISSTMQQQTGSSSKYFAKKIHTARRVTLEAPDLPTAVDCALGGTCVDLTQDDPSEGQENIHSAFGVPPAFDYGEANSCVTSGATKPTRRAEAFASWGSSDEVESPASSCKTSCSQPVLKRANTTRLKPYQNPKKSLQKKVGALERGFKRQNETSSQESPEAVIRYKKKSRAGSSLSSFRPIQQAKKSKSLLGYQGFGLTIRIHEREEDDF